LQGLNITVHCVMVMRICTFMVFLDLYPDVSTSTPRYDAQNASSLCLLAANPNILSVSVSPQSPKLFRTLRFTTPSYSSRFSLHILAASTFAGLSSFGSASILITLIRIFSTL
jgi:hypothetical protein